MGCEDGLEVFGVFGADLCLHPKGNGGLAEGEKGFLELLVGTVVEKTQGPSAGSGVVYHFRDHALVLAEVQLVADTDLAGRIDDHVPEALLLVEFAQQEDHDIGAGLFLLAEQACGEDLGVVQDEPVSLAEIIYDVLENSVLYLAAVLVEDHEAALVPPADRLLGYLLLREVEIEL